MQFSFDAIIKALWYLFVTLGILGGFLYSYLIHRIYKIDRPDAVAFRGEIRAVLNADEPEEDSPEILEFRQGMTGINNQVGEVMKGVNGMTALAQSLEDLLVDAKKLPKRIDGAMGRQVRAVNAEQKEVFDGLDLMMKQAVSAEIKNPIVRGVIHQLMENGNPQHVAWAQEWFLQNPHAQSLLSSGEAGQTTPVAGSQAKSEIDQYI